MFLSLCSHLEFEALSESPFLEERFELATQGTYFNLKQTFSFLRCMVV